RVRVRGGEARCGAVPAAGGQGADLPARRRRPRCIHRRAPSAGVLRGGGGARSRCAALDVGTLAGALHAARARPLGPRVVRDPLAGRRQQGAAAPRRIGRRAHARGARRERRAARHAAVTPPASRLRVTVRWLAGGAALVIAAWITWRARTLVLPCFLS